MRKILWAIMAVGLSLAGGGFSLAAEKGVMAGMTQAHNMVRAELGLPQVVWSDELARFAEEWAQYLVERNGCRMRHHPGQDKRALPYGENLYWASAIRQGNGRRKRQDITPQKVINSWVSERQDYDPARNGCGRGESCGHYTQVVWRSTRRIGCGMATCSDMSQIWVCNYDPPGNFIGQSPY
ncbi:MAG: CAP domain-containing protein [Desulfobulbaceae bacterium]